MNQNSKSSSVAAAAHGTRSSLTPLLSIARTVRWLPDRLLHPVRRRAALARLRARPAPVRILCLCHGNICRSPYAATALIRALPPHSRSRTTVGSSGFIGPDRPPPREALRVAASRGIDLSAHRSQLVTADAVRDAELIVVMDQRQRRAIHSMFGKPYRDVLVLGDLDPHPASRRTIRDPFGEPPDVFFDTYERTDRCIEELAKAMTARIRPETRRPETERCLDPRF